jgi:hypothetical protein
LTSEIRSAIINRKSNACPMMVRLAWHASGTFDKNATEKVGGSNGSTMRFAPESTDGANKGLHISTDMLHLVKVNHPEISYSDLWTYAGAQAVEFLGGPKVPHKFGRVDHPNDSHVPENGRLPDASQGAQHLRDVFYRMGFNDQEIVALSGAHTLGRCHLVRSGFDGPWTRNPLNFDNEYFRNLLHLEWKIKEWEGPQQFADVETGELMMLPTDIALKTDPEFRKYVEIYANSQEKFFEDFSAAFSKLLHLGCPVKNPESKTDNDVLSAKFREAAMHGSLGPVQELSKKCDVHQLEKSSGRSALHKAAFWGHLDTVKFLSGELKMNVNQQDYAGDTAAHDAARFGHLEVIKVLIENGSNLALKNEEGKTVLDTAVQYEKHEVVAHLKKFSN